MTAEVADYIQIFLLAMIVCWMVMREIQGEQPVFQYFFGITLLAVATIISLVIAYGVLWLVVHGFNFLTTTDFVELLRRRGGG